MNPDVVGQSVIKRFDRAEVFKIFRFQQAPAQEKVETEQEQWGETSDQDQAMIVMRRSSDLRPRPSEHFNGYPTFGALILERMAVVRARIQTVEDMYQLVWKAIAGKRPIEAVYDKRLRLFCPHRLGRNRAGELRVLCYQYGGESKSGLEAPGSPDNWRCTALEKFSQVKLLEGAWRTAPNHSRPASCVINPVIDAEDDPPGNRQQEQ